METDREHGDFACPKCGLAGPREVLEALSIGSVTEVPGLRARLGSDDLHALLRWRATYTRAQVREAIRRHTEPARILEQFKAAKVSLVKGVEGLALYINDSRVCGPKPWGGGPVLREWTEVDLTEALKGVR
jgi:hypothetical protein